MRRSLLLILWCLAMPLAAQSPVRVQTDSLRAETCRGGTLKGNTCTGRKATLRLSVVRRLAARIDSLDAQSAPRDTTPPVVVPPKDTTPAPLPRDTTPPPAPVDTTPTPPPPPPPPPAPATGAGVELPRVVPTWPAALETAACTQTVTANLQAALSAARAGDVLCLVGTHVGNFRLAPRADSGWVVVRSLDETVAAGQRQRPSLGGSLARVQGVGVSPTLTITGGGWYLRSLDIAAESTTTVVYTIIDITGARVVLDRVWVHPPTNRGTQRCVALNGGATAVVHSWLSDCHGKGFDSQAIVGWNGPGPYLIEDNTLEGAGENVMFGGADPSTTGLVPSDITVRRNWIVTPPSWKGTWTKKNLFETKNVRRLLLEENVLEHSWPDGQAGEAIVLKAANQGGHCTWCTATDITVRDNLILDVVRPLYVVGKDGAHPIDSAMRRVVIERNWAERFGAQAQLLGVMNGATALTIRGNVLLGAAKNDLFVATANKVEATGLVFTDNILTRGTYPLHGCGTVITACFPSATISGNAFLGATWKPTVPGIDAAPDLAAARARGAGFDRATLDALLVGVVLLP